MHQNEGTPPTPAQDIARHLLKTLQRERDDAGRGPRGRRLAIATTDAERMVAWLDHTDREGDEA